MSQDVKLEVHTGERAPLVVKTAISEAGSALLDQEARRLHACRHPGVVELLEAERGRLVLAWAGAETLELHRPSLPAAAAILASTASTVADLHGLGIVHGRLTPDHVLIGGDGRPRVGGLRGPAPGEPEPHPTDDVAAVGHLIDRLVGPGAEMEPIPERRWGRRRWSGYHRRSLQLLADRATDPDPARRPTMRALAGAIVEAVPEARIGATITDQVGTDGSTAPQDRSTQDGPALESPTIGQPIGSRTQDGSTTDAPTGDSHGTPRATGTGCVDHGSGPAVEPAAGEAPACDPDAGVPCGPADAPRMERADAPSPEVRTVASSRDADGHRHAGGGVMDPAASEAGAPDGAPGTPDRSVEHDGSEVAAASDARPLPDCPGSPTEPTASPPPDVEAPLDPDPASGLWASLRDGSVPSRVRAEQDDPVHRPGGRAVSGSPDGSGSADGPGMLDPTPDGPGDVLLRSRPSPGRRTRSARAAMSAGAAIVVVVALAITATTRSARVTEGAAEPDAGSASTAPPLEPGSTPTAAGPPSSPLTSEGARVPGGEATEEHPIDGPDLENGAADGIGTPPEPEPPAANGDRCAGVGSFSGSAVPDPSGSDRPIADVDGDGCTDQIRIDGRTVEVDGATYEVGEDGDRVAVADWDCDGSATAGLLRPSTGEVFLFDTWAEQGHDVSVDPVAELDDADALVVDGATCGPPAVRLSDGRTTQLKLGEGS